MKFYLQNYLIKTQKRFISEKFVKQSHLKCYKLTIWQSLKLLFSENKKNQPWIGDYINKWKQKKWLKNKKY